MTNPKYTRIELELAPDGAKMWRFNGDTKELQELLEEALDYFLFVNGETGAGAPTVKQVTQTPVDPLPSPTRYHQLDIVGTSRSVASQIGELDGDH